jgi:hypothetical protein
VPERTDFKVHGSANQGFRSFLQLDRRVREVSWTQDKLPDRRTPKAYADQAFAVFDKKQFALRLDTVRVALPGWPLANANDASWEKIRKGKCILRADLCETVRSIDARTNGLEGSRRGEPQPTAQGHERGRKIRSTQLSKPRLNAIGAVDSRFNFDGAKRREQYVEVRNMVQGKSKNRQPVGEAVAGERAECNYLVQAGTELWFSERGVKVVWDWRNAWLKTLGT